jgi:signal peptidase II
MSTVKAITKHLLLPAAMASIVGCDRVTKHVATETLAGEPTQSYLFDVIRLSYAENTGSFLSLGADWPEPFRFTLFVLGSGGLLVFLLVYAIRTRWSGAKLFALGLFVAGGASNWADRVMVGHVVDFLNVGVGPIRTGIFNVADVAILAGVAMLVFSDYWRGRKRRHGTSRSA